MPTFKSEYSQLFRLAWPLMISQLAQMGIGVVDTLMAGRYSSIDLAGVALGGAVLMPCMLLMMGILQAVTPTVAQLNGANRQSEIAEVVRQGLWISLAASFFIIILIINAAPFYRLMNVDADAIAISLPYLKYTAFGIPALMGYFVLRFLAEGLGFTRPSMYIAVMILFLKIPLNYIFVYGLFGLPEMGGAGCGLSSALVMWFEFFLIAYVVTRSKFQNIGWQNCFNWPQWPVIKSLVIVGAPIGATIFFEVGMFTFVTLLLGQIGANAVASHTIAMNFSSLTYMLPLALGIAASIRIGFNLGSDRADLARITAKVAMISTVLMALMTISFILLTRHFIIGLYTKDVEVYEIAVTLMLFVAVYQLFDNIQVTAIGALRGYKDTKVPMIFVVIVFWFFGLPLAAALGFGWFGPAMGIYGFWVGLIAALFAVSLCALFRLYWVSGEKTINLKT